MDTILFNNKEFPIREVELPNIGVVFISVNSLNKLLFNEDGSFLSSEAESVDNTIFYYVDENEFLFSDADLLNLLHLEVL